MRSLRTTFMLMRASAPQSRVGAKVGADHTLARPNQNNRLKMLSFSLLNGGERGIRTLDELLTHTPLAGERLQPLGHLSVGAGIVADSRMIASSATCLTVAVLVQERANDEGPHRPLRASARRPNQSSSRPSSAM